MNSNDMEKYGNDVNNKENEAGEGELKLEKKLSKVNVWALSFGCIIGSGAFLLPGTSFLPKAGPLGASLAMAVGALVMMVIAENYNYMIARFPVAGGELTYAGEAFGRKHSFICAWYLSLSYLMIVPFNASALPMVARSFFGDLFEKGFHYEVAGYEIYMGEIALAGAALVLFAYLNIRGVELAGKIQTILSCSLAACVVVIFLAALFKGTLTPENLAPAFPGAETAASAAGGAAGASYSLKSALAGTVKVLAVAPFCFLGFDTAAQTAEEMNFSEKRTRNIMFVAIIFGAFIYIALNLVAASARPGAFATWEEYVDAIARDADSAASTSGSGSGAGNAPLLSGIESIATFNAARSLLGAPGLFFIGIAVLSAMCTGITGFYLATSRTMYRMAKEKMLPAFFGSLHAGYKTPAKTLIFILAVALIAPFFGRTALGWIVDLASLGTAIGYGYTSLAAWKFARREGNRAVAATGALGTLFAFIFAALLIIPIPFFSCSLGKESLICLAVWTVLGIAFYRYANAKAANSAKTGVKSR